MKKELKKLAKWSYFMGVCGLLIGAFFSLLGFPFLYVGAIPGLLTVLLSIRLLQASRSAKRLNLNLRLKQTEDGYDKTLAIFASYFRLQALLMMVVLLMIGGSIVAGFTMDIDYVELIKKDYVIFLPSK